MKILIKYDQKDFPVDDIIAFADSIKEFFSSNSYLTENDIVIVPKQIDIYLLENEFDKVIKL